MVCATVKAGSDCAFMTKVGCGYNGGSCHPVVEQCDGCNRSSEFPAGKFCNSYPNPAVKWKIATCNFATHLKSEAKNEQKVNPLKASKRAHKK